MWITIYMKYLFTLIISIILLACNNQELKTIDKASSEMEYATRTNTIVFNWSLKPVLSSYYELKDNFIDQNDQFIDSTSKKLIKAIESLKLNELNDESTLMHTSKSYIEGIKAELIGLLGENLRKDKMKSFQMISEQLFDFIKLVQYDGEVIYRINCPMAFNNNGATWMSNSTIIKNPYLSDAMLNCGELIDTIDFKIKSTTK